MSKGKKGLRKGSSPSKRPHVTVVAPGNYDRLIIGNVRNVIKNLKRSGLYNEGR